MIGAVEQYVPEILFQLGCMVAAYKAIQRDIVRLERKVELHNAYDRRLTRLEARDEMFVLKEKGAQ